MVGHPLRGSSESYNPKTRGTSFIYRPIAYLIIRAANSENTPELGPTIHWQNACKTFEVNIPEAMLQDIAEKRR